MSEHPTTLADLIGEQGGAAHSIFAPSSSAMWLRCLGSLIPNVLALDSSGIEAAEGTVAHDVADQWQRSGHRPDEKVGEIVTENGFDIEITESMLAYVEDYLNWCKDVGFEFVHYSEQRVDLSILMPIPKQGGTADHFACKMGRLVITDLKYGTGVRVYAADIDLSDVRWMIDGKYNGNTQALFYAAGVFIEWDHVYHFETIAIRICHPRLGVFETWETTRSELLDFMQYVMDRAPLALEANAPRTPHPKACLWCRVNHNCPARLAHLEELIDNTFHNLDESTRDYSMAEMEAVTEMISDELTVDFLPALRAPQAIPIHALEKILPYRGIIEKWFASINDYLTNAAVVDEAELRMYKVVEGRTNRKFKDEKQAVEDLLLLGLTIKDIQTTSTVTPAQAEDALHKRLKVRKTAAKALLQDMVYQPPGPKTLALKTDSRLELPSAGDVFAPLD